jgi:hypothetical protein
MFNINDVVLYKNGEQYKLGIIKEVIPYERRAYTKQDGLFGAPTGEVYTAYKYRVWYHMGDTTALTDEHLLHPISNAYAFNIARKQADKNINHPMTCRRIASILLDELEFHGEMYYKLEDWLTAKLQGEEINIPFGLESEYLLCALRIEVRNLLDSVEFYYTPEDIEEIVRRMINDFSNSVLNNDYIEDTIKAYIIEKGGEV